MEQELFLLILTIVSVILGWVLHKFKLDNFTDTKDLIIKALEDKKITKEELSAIVEQFSKDLKE